MTTVLLLTAAVVGCTANAPSKDFTRTITKEFPISPDGVVEINNRYGNIDIQTWDRAMVKFEVTITVDTRNEDKANETFERITIDFDDSQSRVEATTEIASISNWKRWFGGSSDKFEIDYAVSLPPTVSLDIENKYGDLYITHMESDGEITVKYGNLRLDGFGGDVSMELAYGKGSLTSARDLDLNISYATLRCTELGDLTVDSKYSHLEVQSAVDIRSNSSYDNYEVEQLQTFDNVGKYDDIVIGEVASIDIKTKYTNIDVDVLTEEAEFDLKYGGAKIRNVRSGFSQIEVRSSYTGVSIDVDDNASFTVEAYCEYCPVRDSGLEVYFEKRKSSETELKGFRGSRDASSRIVTEMKYGSLTIK